MLELLYYCDWCGGYKNMLKRSKSHGTNTHILMSTNKAEEIWVISMSIIWLKHCPTVSASYYHSGQPSTGHAGPLLFLTTACDSTIISKWKSLIKKRRHSRLPNQLCLLQGGLLPIYGKGSTFPANEKRYMAYPILLIITWLGQDWREMILDHCLSVLQ